MKRLHTKQWAVVAAITVGVLAVSGGAYAMGRHVSESNTSTVSQPSNHRVDETISKASTQRIDAAISADSAAYVDQSVDERLLYLIEEEKLAHDVYQKMYDLYGVRTFSNIARSESQHQNLVLAVLEARSLVDPRSAKAGVFINQDLQRLYDTLIARGSQSLSDAYAVGVTIEEVDIADLTADLKLVDAGETSVINMMNTLKNGSYNHLNAFNRHV